MVDGLVTNFRPMPYEGHQEACSSVQSETFHYSDYGVTSGFDHSASYGGPIREGLPVPFIGNTIIRLEVGSDALASTAQREVVAVEANKDWTPRQEHDQVLDRITLGFGVAVVFMTAWWNLQPLRFTRFWLKPPYKRRTVILFRLFFAANLVGAIRYLIEALNRQQRTISEYGVIAAIAAAWIAVIWVMSTVALRLALRRDHMA